MPSRLPCVHHCTSEPYRFFGRAAELALLDDAFAGGAVSVAALVGPGGQGKTAIVQHWLEPVLAGSRRADGVFLWSFYRGKDADLCLRHLHAYAAGLPQPGDVSASYCVDHLLPVLRRERWAVVLDGAEVVQYDAGAWFGRFVHPELGRLLEELASEPLPGVMLVTSRFPLPDVEGRRHARTVRLAGLDAASARELLRSVGVCGTEEELDRAAELGGRHAKAVELLGTYLRRFHHGEACHGADLPCPDYPEGFSDEEQKVARVLAAFQAALPAESQDVLALATAFREPPREEQLLAYLASTPVHTLLHDTWARRYIPFRDRPSGWLADRVRELVELRLLERVGASSSARPPVGAASRAAPPACHAAPGASVRLGSPDLPEEGSGARRLVIDAHPLVRRGFEHVLGAAGRRQSAGARAGFLRERPDRRRPATLEEAREEVELFHAYCDAGLWNEADGTYVALDNPKHRFLAPAFERDLLLRFFPDGDWRRPPLWPGFGRYRSLAICLELLGRFDDALSVYRPADAPLRGDALLALGRLGPLLEQTQVAHPWQSLWQAYRAHALVLAGRTDEALALARTLVPVDIYEWLHLFECLLRAGRLQALDLRSVLYRPPHAAEQRWSELARRRMQADYRRLTESPAPADLGDVYEALIDAYDRGGLPWERCLTRLSYARWLLAHGHSVQAEDAVAVVMDLARRHAMPVVLADAQAVKAEVLRCLGDPGRALGAEQAAEWLRQETGYRGPARP
jgi:hypothetical protein